MVELASGDIVHSFPTEPMRRGSLRHTHVCQNAQTGLSSLTLSYVSSLTGDLVIQTYLPKDDNDTMYSYNPSEPQRRQWGETTQIIRRVPNPGKWETLANGRIVGVRQQAPHKLKEQDLPSPIITPVASSSGLRRRSSTMSDRFMGPARNMKKAENDIWEAWTIDHLSSRPNTDTSAPVESVPLNPPSRDNEALSHDGVAISNSHQNLMISELGPLVKLGTSSVAVGFGNVIKIISVGHEHFDRPRTRLTRDNLRNLAASTRRKRDKEKDRACAGGGGGDGGISGVQGLGRVVMVGSGGAGGGGFGLATEAGNSRHGPVSLISGRARGESINSYDDWGWSQDK